MKTAIYSRVSTEKQNTDSQMKELEAYSKGKDCIWFSDKFTGRKMSRPGMDKLLAAVRRGEVNRIVIYDLSRLGRTAKGLTALFEELIERKCTLVSLKDGIDLLTPSGRLIANVLASVAQFETEMRREKVLAGIAAKKAKGEKWNNGRPKGSVKWTEQDVEAIRSMKASGLPMTKIVARTKLSRSTVYNILGGGTEMNLSKANAKKYSSWAFQQQRKIADMPLLIGQLLTKSEGLTILYKVIVVREAVNPISQSNPRTPVVYESEIHKSEKSAWEDAIENCT